MKITKLEKKKRLYLLETDQDQKIYITEDTIIRFFLSKDKEITEEELKEIQTFAQKSVLLKLSVYQTKLSWEFRFHILTLQVL